MSVLLLVPVFFLLALLLPTAWSLVRAYRRCRGPRQVRCPEIGELVEIEIDPKYALKMHVIGYPGARVRSCARWPERSSCAQPCVAA
jgi:hypothetical protein